MSLAAGFIGLLVACGAGGASAAADEARSAGAESRLEITVDEGQLALRAEEVPLVNLLSAIGEHAGFEVSIRGEPGPPISVSFIDEPIEEALRRLLRERSAAVVFTHSNADGERHLSAVRVRLLQTGADPTGVGAADAASASEVSGGTSSGAGSLTAHEPHQPRADYVVTPYHPREERLRFARSTARARQPSSAESENLTMLLSEDPDSTVRGLAAAALGRLGGADAGEALAEALSDRNWRVRRRAVRALGQTWGNQAIEPLAKLLAKERARRVRRVAAYTLGRLGGEAARETLEPLRDDPDPHVRRIANLALGDPKE